MSVINGNKGDWRVRVNRGQEPESITFQYTPRQDANGCPDVRLAQTSKRMAFDAAGNPVDVSDGVQAAGLDNPFEHRKDDEITDAGGTKRSMDHRRCEGDPYVNGGDPEEQPASKGDATKDPPDPTINSDAPGGAFAVIKPNIQRVVVDFEICAVCAATGENLGCLQWKSIWERVPPPRDEQRTGRIEFDHVQAEQPPSKGFTLAFWRFLINHVKGTPDGKTRFVCQEPKAGEDPNRGEAPEPLLKRLLAKPEEPAGGGGGGGGGEGEDENGSEEPGADRRQGFLIDPDDEDLGTGLRHASLRDAIKAALADPTAAAVKLSWAGTQAPALPSALFAGPLGIAPVLVAPFIESQSDFASDFIRISTQVLNKEHLRLLIKALGKAAKRPGSDGLVALSLISQVHDPGRARAFTLRVSGDRVAGVMDRMLSLKGVSAAERAIYQYVFLNFRESAYNPQAPKRPKKKSLGYWIEYFFELLKRFWDGIVIPIGDTPQIAGLLAPCDTEARLVMPDLLPARVTVELLPVGQELDVPDRDAAIDAARDALRGAADQVSADGRATDEVPSNLGDQKTPQERRWRQERDRAAREELRRNAEGRPDGDTQHEVIRAAGQTVITHRICTFWANKPYQSGTQTINCCVLRKISVQPRAQVRINPARELYIEREGTDQKRINQDQFNGLNANQQARFVLAAPFSIEAHERAHVDDYVRLLEGELASLRFRGFVTTQVEFDANDRRVRNHVQNICDFTYARYTLRDLQQYPHGHSEKVAVRTQRQAIEAGEAASRAGFAHADRAASKAVDDAINKEISEGNRRCVHQPDVTPHCLRGD